MKYDCVLQLSQEARHWDGAAGKAKDLDFSAAGGALEAGSGDAKALDLGRSLVDAADEPSDSDFEVGSV